jgi:AcrR family transcriptional regulator
MAPIPELEVIRRAQILEAGVKTLAARGCSNVKMDDICRAAGMSKGGVAHYFKSKNELFITICRDFFAKIFTRSEERMAELDDPLEKILSFDWLYNAEDPEVNIGYPILFDFMSQAVHNPEYRSAFTEWLDNWTALLDDALKEGVKRGQFHSFTTDEAARNISAIYQGIAIRWYMDPESHPTEWALDSYRKAIMGLLSEYII